MKISSASGSVNECLLLHISPREYAWKSERDGTSVEKVPCIRRRPAMKMKMLGTVTGALLLGCTGGVMAPVVSEERFAEASDCLMEEYSRHVYDTPRPLTADDSSGILIGPLATGPEHGIIEKLVLGLEIRHPSTGDLNLSLHYDCDNNGTIDAGSPIEFHLMRMHPCEGEELYACFAELEGAYYLRDEGWKEAGETASFAVFEHLPAGGSFYLRAVDVCEDHSGVISSWAVFLLQKEVSHDDGSGLIPGDAHFFSFDSIDR
jgi:hypothetical protein